MQIKGTVKFIGATQQVKDTFKKREFCVEFQDGNYTKMVAMQMVQDKCSVLDKYAIGQEVTADVNIESREHQGKFYTTITCWKLNSEVSTSANQVPANVTPESYDPNAPLPF